MLLIYSTVVSNFKNMEAVQAIATGVVIALCWELSCLIVLILSGSCITMGQKHIR